MSSLPSKILFSRRKIISKGFKVIWFVINNFFVSFEISCGSYNLSQNTLRLINEFEKCTLPFMESLIADFIQFFSTIAKFLLLSSYSDNDIVLFHLQLKETRLTNKKVSKNFVRDGSSSKVGSVQTYVEKVTTS